MPASDLRKCQIAELQLRPASNGITATPAEWPLVLCGDLLPPATQAIRHPATLPGPGGCAAPPPAGPPHALPRSLAASAAPAPAAPCGSALSRPGAGSSAREGP